MTVGRHKQFQRAMLPHDARMGARREWDEAEREQEGGQTREDAGESQQAKKNGGVAAIEQGAGRERCDQRDSRSGIVEDGVCQKRAQRA